MARLALILLAILAAFPASAEESFMRELTPTGKLRVAIGVGPAASAFYSMRDATTGKPRGVAVDLGAALAKKLGVPIEYVEFPSSGEITAAADRDVWDVTFMPVDAERARSVDFAPAYCRFESTYLVPAGSKIQSIAEVDRPGVRVIGVDNTTTARGAAAALKQTQIKTFRGVEELIAEVAAGRADAVALSKVSLKNFAAQVPGTRVLPGHFWASTVAPAVGKSRPNALAYVADFIEAAKADGTVRRALDAAGLQDAEIAPPR
jgi:polar amino acid transport system substrate-binding protein